MRGEPIDGSCEEEGLELTHFTSKRICLDVQRIDSRETVADEKDQLGGWQGRKLAQTPVGAEEVGRRHWMLN